MVSYSYSDIMDGQCDPRQFVSSEDAYRNSSCPSHSHNLLGHLQVIAQHPVCQRVLVQDKHSWHTVEREGAWSTAEL